MMCLITVPKKIYVAVAEADSITELNAFDACLVKIGLPNVSLIKVTSLLPSDVEIVKEPPKFPHGANVPSIYATVTSKRKGEIISAAIAIGWTNGGPTLVAEFAGEGKNKDEAEKIVLQILWEMARVRGLKLVKTEVKSIEHIVEKCGCVLAIVAEVE